MNKNTLIGTILMGLIFVGMVWTSQPSAEQLEARRLEALRQDSINNALQEAMNEALAPDTIAEQDSIILAQADSIQNVRRNQKFGNLAFAAQGTEQVINLKNNRLSVDVTSKGGVLQSATLLEYKDYQDNQLEMFNADNNKMYFTFRSVTGQFLSTEDLYFQPVEKTDTSVVMRLYTPDGGLLDFIYALVPDSYLLDFTIRTQNFNNIVAPTESSIQMTWNQKLVRTELGRSFEELKSIIDRVESQLITHHSSLVTGRSRLGICLDTCHVWDGGYDVRDNFDGVLAEFDRVIGLSRLCAVHLNDSMNPRGAKKDRHALIGSGEIGEEALLRVLTHPALRGLPFILETPTDDVGHGIEIAHLKSAYQES